MKILHVAPSYFPAHRHGGPIASVHAMNKALVAAGVDVTVYTTNIDGRGALDVPLEKETILDGVKIIYFPLTWRAWEYSRSLHRALEKNIENFDLVHLTSVFLSASTLGAYYAKKFGVPYLISPRGSLMKEPLAMKSALLKRIYLAFIERRNLAHAAAIHFTVKGEEEEYIAAELPLRRSFVIPNSFELPEETKDADGEAFRKKLEVSSGVKMVLALGRINWKKGFDTLIPAFAEVVCEIPRAVLVIAGSDEEGYQKNVQLSIINYQLPNKVIFTGMLTGAEKWSAFAGSDVFALPSYSENFGMAVVEAMAMGIPVVVSDKVGIAPEIAAADAGKVTEKEPQTFARAVLELLRDDKKSRAMGERGRALVRKRFAPEKVAQVFMSAYNELVQSWPQKSTPSSLRRTRR
ncbi:MAG: glycosyltransferase [Candidatus Brennerbacteria bacterium]|nr:glycosyltransferase [Candidatus Brennerbacteria bacterium]